MIKKMLVFVLVALSTSTALFGAPKPTPKHMEWWREARYGMFIHWGLSSMFGGEISWTRPHYGAQKYDSLALRFNPSQFNADAWVKTAKDAGMRYMVFTAKHHDGFCMWDTRSTPHNIINTPYGRDICRQLADAAHRQGLRLGWYLSVRDWSDPDCADSARMPIYVERLKTEVRELLSNYGKIDLLWFDYDGWVSPADPAEIFALCKSLQPDIVINNRLEPLTPDESHARVGPYAEYATPEQFVGSYGEVPWECCANLARSGQWAYHRNDTPRTVEVMVDQLMHTVGANGNLLLNVGPDSLGVIPAAFVDRLAEIGRWVNQYPDALYGTRGGPLLPTPKYVTTRKGNTFYITAFKGVDARIALSPALAAVIERISVLDLPQGAAELVDVDRKNPYIALNESIVRADHTVIKVVCRGDISYFEPVPPPSISGSLAYYAKATASSSLGEHYMHHAAAAVDDSPKTSWVIGRREDLDLSRVYGVFAHQNDIAAQAKVYHTDGWLEVELDGARMVGRAVVQARKYYVRSLIHSIQLQYQRAGRWLTVASANFSEPDEWQTDWQPTFQPVQAARWRLLIDKGSGFFGVSEFQLFER